MDSSDLWQSFFFLFSLIRKHLRVCVCVCVVEDVCLACFASSLHPGLGHPLSVLVQSLDRTRRLLEGLRELAVDHGHVKPVTVPELHPLAGLQHCSELVVLREKRKDVLH